MLECIFAVFMVSPCFSFNLLLCLLFIKKYYPFVGNNDNNIIIRFLLNLIQFTNYAATELNQNLSIANHPYHPIRTFASLIQQSSSQSHHCLGCKLKAKCSTFLFCCVTKRSYQIPFFNLSNKFRILKRNEIFLRLLSKYSPKQNVTT